MPGGVLDIVGSHGLVEFELAPAGAVAFCIITGDPALPVVGRLVRDEFEILVEVRHRILHPSQLEEFNPPLLVDQGGAGGWRGRGGLRWTSSTWKPAALR